MSDELLETRLAVVRRVSKWRGQVTKEKTIRNWTGFPWPDRYPTPFAPIEAWLEANAPRPKRAAAAPEAAEVELRMRLLQEQIRHLEAKNEILEGTRLDADVVVSAIAAGNADLKRELLSDLPVSLWTLSQDKPADAAVPLLRSAIEGALTRHLERCLRCTARPDPNDSGDAQSTP